MTDSNTISDGHREKLQISELAVISLLIPIIVASAWMIFLFFLEINNWRYNGVPLSNPLLLMISFLLSITLFLFIAPVFAWLAMNKIKKSNGLLKGYNYAYIGLIFSIAGLGLLAYLRFFPYVVIIMMWWDILKK